MAIYGKIKSGETSCDTTKAKFHDDIEVSKEPKDGFYEIVNGNEKPDQDEKYILYHLEVTDGKLVKTYSKGPEPEPPPVPEPVYIYSKKKFFLSLAKRGIFKEVKEWMDATEVIEGTGLTVSFLLSESTYMKSDDSDFLAIKAVADAKFGADKFAEVLQESIDEG